MNCCKIQWISVIKNTTKMRVNLLNDQFIHVIGTTLSKLFLKDFTEMQQIFEVRALRNRCDNSVYMDIYIKNTIN